MVLDVVGDVAEGVEDGLFLEMGGVGEKDSLVAAPFPLAPVGDE